MARLPDRVAAARSRRIRRDDPSYPPLLGVIDDAPPSLWVRGDASLLAATAVAVVGARHATALGLEMGERLGAGLAAAGIVVVSGCAIGIDAAAHRGALDVGGATVAVLAGGLDVAVPPSNRSLASRIVREGGCLAGEHADGTPIAGRWAFPRRNRIIAGLARVVVVVEAAARSGALITARLALGAGREVLVVPGHPLTEAYAGSNALLGDGARPVLDAGDVLAELAGLPRLDVARLPADRGDAARRDPPRDRAGLRARVHASLGSEPRAPESLALALGLPVGAVLGALTELELVGLARVRPGQRFSLPREPPRRDEG
ncbi:MAG TPA: DNA-processing protein DprA [Gemmatimonadota bacterium]|jgi:DNA processing protein